MQSVQPSVWDAALKGQSRAMDTARGLILASRYQLALFLGYNQPPHRWDPFHRAYCEMRLPELDKIPGRRHLSLWPRGTYKTAIGQIVDCVYDILTDPEGTTLLGSWKYAIALKMSRKVKEHLEDPRLIALFPDILWTRAKTEAPKWTEGEFTVRRKTASADATLTAFSLESLPVGLHANKKVRLDDVVEERNVQTEDGLLKVKERCLDIKNLKAAEDTPIEVTGTRWDPDDWYADLEKPGSGWIVDRFSALEEDPPLSALFSTTPDNRRVIDLSRFTPRFPNAKPISQIARDYQDEVNAGHDALHFSGQILLRMERVEGSLWGDLPKKYFDLDDVPARFEGAITVDLATDAGAFDTKRHCDSVATACVRPADGRVLIVDGRAGNLTPYELTEALYEMHREWGLTTYIEEVGLAKFFELALEAGEKRHGYPLPHHAFSRNASDGSKTSRIRSLDGWYNAGNLLCLDPETLEHGPQREYFVKYLHQACRFPKSELVDILDTVADQVHLVRAPLHGDRDQSRKTRRQKAIASAKIRKHKGRPR